jgi:predicted metal-dependent enzyme (double-stranded beta helix superfamily)
MEGLAVFLEEVDRLVRLSGLSDLMLCAELSRELRPLLDDARWVPAELTESVGVSYRRECLYEAPDGAYSVGLFTWYPGRRSRIHDHSGWSIVGNITGVLRTEHFLAVDAGRAVKQLPDTLLKPGEVLAGTPGAGDIHRVSVASPTMSVSIHLYGSRFDAVNRAYYTEVEERA